MSVNNIAAIFDVLSNNSADVEEIVRRFGGVGNLIKCGPALVRIMTTIAAHAHPDQQAEAVSKLVTYYDDETRAKVQAFQLKHHLHPDGLVGNETWGAVEQLLAHVEQEND